MTLLDSFDAPPRLVAHLRLVHDIGKAVRRDELSGPGHEHEPVGCQLLADRLAVASGQEPWEVFLELDEVLQRIAAGADERLGYQFSFPVTFPGRASSESV